MEHSGDKKERTAKGWETLPRLPEGPVEGLGTGPTEPSLVQAPPGPFVSLPTPTGVTAPPKLPPRPDMDSFDALFVDLEEPQVKTPSGPGAPPPLAPPPEWPGEESVDAYPPLVFEDEDRDDPPQGEGSTAERRSPLRRPISSADHLGTNLWEPKLRRPMDSGFHDALTIDGRYRVLDQLGDGGMARVLKVTHLELGKEFALKIVHDNLSANSAAKQMFYREAQLASSLEHPNIVQVTDFGVDPKLGAYIVMQYLKGETLRARLQRSGGLSLAQGLPIALQVAQALHYMHGQNVIHCDVKSENIFLCRPPAGERQILQVKLIDFGLSRRDAAGAQLAPAEVAGTPEYVAPEQIRGAAPQPSMDIYSLGVLLYEILAGRTPFSGSPQDLLFAHLNARPAPPSELLPEPLDEGVEQLVLRLLEKEPAQRPSSMGQVIYQLRTLIEMLGLSRFRKAITLAKEPRLSPDMDHLRAMVETNPCPMFRVDADGVLVAVNRAFADFVRVAAAELPGTALADTRLVYVYPDVQAKVASALEDARSRPVVRTVAFGGKEGGATVRIVLIPEEPRPQGEAEGRFVCGFIHPLSGECGGEK